MLRFQNAYTSALFLGAPFSMGALTAFLFNRRQHATVGRTIGLATSMTMVVGCIAFLLATEGLICLLMALPLAIVVAIGGAVMGRSIAMFGQRRLPPAFFAAVALPLLLSVPRPTDGRFVHEVQTSVEIDASPATVWPHVIAFTPIDEPPDLMFRLGIAYPMHASIQGEGPGAIRRCVFSTGAFVEPITAWEPGRRLSFDVVESPDPLRELSIYDDVHPAHLSGYLRPVRGEFRLVALDGGRTRLEGSTWYQIDMGPEGYWQIFSDALITRIHERVLRHIKHEAET